MPSDLNAGTKGIQDETYVGTFDVITGIDSYHLHVYFLCSFQVLLNHKSHSSQKPQTLKSYIGKHCVVPGSFPLDSKTTAFLILTSLLNLHSILAARSGCKRKEKEGSVIRSQQRNTHIMIFTCAMSIFLFRGQLNELHSMKDVMKSCLKSDLLCLTSGKTIRITWHGTFQK